MHDQVAASGVVPASWGAPARWEAAVMQAQNEHTPLILYEPQRDEQLDIDECNQFYHRPSRHRCLRWTPCDFGCFGSCRYTQMGILHT